MLLLPHLALRSGIADEPLRCTAFREPIAPASDAGCVFAMAASPPPRVDGALDDAAWKASDPVTGFVEHHSTSSRPITPGQTEIRCVHSADTLFVAARCEATSPGRIRRARGADLRDGDIFHDDCVELVLVVSQTEMRFVVAAGGARADSLDGDATWNPEWSAAVAGGEREWTVEIAIPFTTLQGRRPPHPDDPGSWLRFNVGRATAPTRLVSSLFSGYDDRHRMGWLFIGTPEQRKARLAARAGIHFEDVSLLLDKWSYDSFDGPARGRLRLVGAGSAIEGPTELRLRLSVVAADGDEALQTFTTRPLTDAVVDFEADTAGLAPGSYRLRAEIVDQNGTVVRTATHPLTRREEPAAVHAGTVPLRIDLPAATAALVSPDSPLPVYAGVPMPRTASTRKTQYRLFDARGRELSCQAEPITTWSPGGDTQWLGLRFLADSPDLTHCELRFAAADGSPSATPARPLKVVRTESGIEVDTGPLRFHVLERGFDGLHRAWFDTDGDGSAEEDERVFTESPAGPYVCDQDGRRYEARLDPDAEVSIESSGPLCAVIRCSGWYVADDGGRICRHVTRFVAHAGLPWLRVFHTLTLCADSREVALSDVGWPLELRAPTGETRFGGEPRPIAVAVGEGGGASLLQHENDAFTLRRFTNDAPENGEVITTGSRAGGWVEASGEGVAVAVGLRDFAATYPRELEADGRGLVLHLWPRRGIDKPIKPPTEDDLSELWFLHHRRLLDFRVPEWFSTFRSPGPFNDAEHEASRHRYVRGSATTNGMGVARSCEFFLNFRTPERDTVRPAWTYMNAPPLAAASPKWMCATGVFGPLEPVDRKSFPLIEQALDVRHDGERSIERFSVGMFNHGGSTSYFRPAKGSYDQLDRPWRLTHHGSPRVPWLLFARSGQRKFADYALRHGGWCADLGFCHYSTPEFERLGVEGKIRGAQCDYKGIVPWSRGGRVMDYNSMADFLVWMTCFTGDRRSLEVADEWGRCVKQRFRPVVGRSAAGTLDTLLSLYEATWDMDYRELAERQFRAIADAEFLPSGHFRQGPWYDYAPWLAHYHRFTGSQRAADMAVAWSNRLLRDCWLGDGTLGQDTMFVPTMGYPLYDVFRIAFEASGDRRLLDFAYGCSLLPALSTVSAPGTPFHGFDTYATASHGGYYTQTVPYLLPALAKHGHDRALFPRWSLHGDKIEFFVKAEGEEPLELRVRLAPLVASATQAADPPPHVKLMSDGGAVTGPTPLEMVRQPIRDGEPRPGDNVHGFDEYARIVIPAEMLGHTVAVVLAHPRSRAEVGIHAPIQMNRPARLVYRWDRGIRFGRGSALYFQPPRSAREVSIRASTDSYRSPHMIALLDGADVPRAVRQWHPTAGGNAVVVKATLEEQDRRGLWCCLQGLTKHLSIIPESPAVPPFFADRPERFFIPDVGP